MLYRGKRTSSWSRHCTTVKRDMKRSMSCARDQGWMVKSGCDTLIISQTPRNYLTREECRSIESGVSYILSRYRTMFSFSDRIFQVSRFAPSRWTFSIRQFNHFLILYSRQQILSHDLTIQSQQPSRQALMQSRLFKLQLNNPAVLELASIAPRSPAAVLPTPAGRASIAHLALVWTAWIVPPLLDGELRIPARSVSFALPALGFPAQIVSFAHLSIVWTVWVALP